MFQAYDQNDQYQLININQELLEEGVALTDGFINSGQYELFENIAQNFMWEWENGEEIIFYTKIKR